MIFKKNRNKLNCIDKSKLASDIMEDGIIMLTLAKLCREFQVSIPSELSAMADERIEKFSVKPETIYPGTLFLISRDGLDSAETLKCSEEGGAVGFITDESDREALEAQGHTIPVIYVENLMDRLAKLFGEMVRARNLKKVAITGTVGKTTTKEFIRMAAGEKYNTFYSKKNNNSFRTIYKNILNKLTDQHELYVQEVGAGYGGTVGFMGSIIEPDIFVLTNVHHHHISDYGTFENLFADKISMQDYMPADGKIIVNFDDEGLANTKFKRKVISVGIDTKLKVDYRGKNIIQKNEILEMDIAYPKGTKHFRLHALGEHNAYNVLLAFATARELGVDDATALKNIGKYRTSGIRQNYKNVGGYRVLIDCYNVCNASIEAGIDAVQNFELAEGCKKFAVLGGENKIGAGASDITYEFGKSLADCQMDYILCFGSEGRSDEDINDYGDGRALCRGLIDGGYKNTEFICDRNELIDRIKALVKPGDLIFFKGIWLLDLAQIIDLVFGTAFSFSYTTYSNEGKVMEEGNYRVKLIKNMPGVEVIEYNGNDSELCIPDEICGYPVIRIKDAVFSNHDEIKKLTIGSNVFNIGPGAFAGCTGLTHLHIPSGVKFISKNAFADCASLTRVEFSEGLIHIGANAFRNCIKLEQPYIPNSVGFMAKSAFKKENAAE